MKIGVNINCYKPLSVERQIELMKQNGFTATFVLADTPNLYQIIDACKNAGIFVESLHAPFFGVNALWEDNEKGEAYFDTQMRAVKDCANNGIHKLVVHLSTKFPPPLVTPIGMQRIGKLCDYAKQHGVTLAFENQRSLGNLASVLERFPDAGFCWDVGHEYCFTDSAIDFMATFGRRIAAIHTHDNHAKHDGDEHLIPFDGVIDYERVAQKLAKANYQGALMLELATSESNAYINTPPEEYYARAGIAAKKIAELVEQYR